MRTPFFSPYPMKKRRTKLAGELNELRIRRLIQLIYPDTHKPIPIESIPIDLRIILCAYVRSNANESLTALLPIELDQRALRLSPSRNFSCELIRRLFRNSIIHVDPTNSPLSSFAIGEKNNVAYYIDSAIFTPNVADPDGNLFSLKELSSCIENNLTPLSQNDVDCLESLWKELALQESLEYLNFVLSEREFPFKPGEKTISVLKLVLTKFSTSQAFYFIYSAAKNASDFYQSQKVNRHHAANTIPGKIQSLFDRATSENWDVKKYGRNYKSCPPSSLNNVLYDKVLGLAGLNYVPGSVLPVVENKHE